MTEEEKEEVSSNSNSNNSNKRKGLSSVDEEKNSDVIIAADEENACLKKSRTWSIETKSFCAWHRLINTSAGFVAFGDKSFVLKLLRDEENSKVKVSIVVTATTISSESILIAVQTIFNKLHTDTTFDRYNSVAYQVVTSRDMTLDTINIPDTWCRSDGVSCVYFQRGIVNIRAFVVGIEKYRNSTERVKVLERWQTKITMPSTNTPFDIKIAVEDLKDSESVVFHTLKKGTRMVVPRPTPAICMPKDVDIIEVKPLNNQEILNFHQRRGEYVRSSLRRYRKEFPAGVTDWLTPLYKCPQTCCDHLGSIIMLVYVVDNTNILM